MPVSYKKLWKLLIDKDMKKKDLCKAAGISSSSIVKLSKNENVTTGVLVKICKALNCDIGDIMEIVDGPDEQRDYRQDSVTRIEREWGLLGYVNKEFSIQ